MSNHVFISDPNKWVLVDSDGAVFYDVLGWRYSVTVNTSAPVISYCNQGFIAVDPAAMSMTLKRQSPGDLVSKPLRLTHNKQPAETTS